MRTEPVEPDMVIVFACVWVEFDDLAAAAAERFDFVGVCVVGDIEFGGVSARPLVPPQSLAPV